MYKLDTGVRLKNLYGQVCDSLAPIYRYNGIESSLFSVHCTYEKLQKENMQKVRIG